MTTKRVLVTAERGASTSEHTIATPIGVPDLTTIPLSRARQVGIRAARTYLQALVGFLVAGGTGAAQAVGVPMPVGDFWALALTSGSLAVAPAAIALLQNAVEILGEFDSPRTRA